MCPANKIRIKMQKVNIRKILDIDCFIFYFYQLISLAHVRTTLSEGKFAGHSVWHQLASIGTALARLCDRGQLFRCSDRAISPVKTPAMATSSLEEGGFLFVC